MSKFIERRSKERTIKKDIVILYHHNCSDGFGGAWAAWKKLGDKAEYIGVRHQIPPPQGLKNKTIYMVDFTYPIPITKELIKENKQVTAIDHHISSEKATKITADYSYALNNSGSVLAWKYFHPKKPAPKMLKYIEDIDLWKFKVPHSKEVFAYLDLFDFNFKTWSGLAVQLEKTAAREQLVRQGKLLLRYESKLIQRLLDKAEVVKFAGHKTLAVNSPLFDSQIGYELYKKMPPMGIIWSQTRDGRKKISLRSNGTVDVSKIAKKFGGGGHKQSAAFLLKSSESLPWKNL